MSASSDSSDWFVCDDLKFSMFFVRIAVAYCPVCGCGSSADGDQIHSEREGLFAADGKKKRGLLQSWSTAACLSKSDPNFLASKFTAY
jgi:hypothetical protein